MIIQLNTDNNIRGSEELQASLEELITTSLGRFADQLTRVEVHLKDDNSHKPGEHDKRCTIEARPEGMQPIAVSDNGNTETQAVKGAIDKLKVALDTAIGRLKNH